MLMNKYFICCERCFEIIGRKNTGAAKLWMNLCALCMQRGNLLEIYTRDLPELRQLETLGFLVTTDKSDNLAIKLKGHCMTEQGEDFFCIKDGNHGS